MSDPAKENELKVLVWAEPPEPKYRLCAILGPEIRYNNRWLSLFRSLFLCLSKSLNLKIKLMEKVGLSIFNILNNLQHNAF